MHDTDVFYTFNLGRLFAIFLLFFFSKLPLNTKNLETGACT